MAVKPAITIDAVDNTGSLDLFINEVFVTNYAFESNQITLSERENVDILTIANFQENILNINTFISLIYKILTVNNVARSRFEEEMKKNIKQIRNKISIRKFID